MAENNEQRETVVVNDNDKGTEPHNTGIVVALIVLIVVLLLIFLGRGLMSGSDDGDSNINVNPPSTNSTEGQ